MPSEAKPRDPAGMVLAGLFVLLGLAVLYASTDLSAMGAVFPRAVAVVMVCAASGVLVQNLLRPAGVRGEGESAPASRGRMPALVLIMAAWVLLMPVAGFVASGIVAFLDLLAAANYDGWPAGRTFAYVAVAVLVVVLFHQLMVRVLHIPVPAGFLI